jgi:hypothetical protein
VVVLLPVVVVDVLVVVVLQAPIVSPWCTCAWNHALQATVIVTNGCFNEWVWWQIVTFRDEVVVVVVVVPVEVELDVVVEALGGLFAKPPPTSAPAPASTTAATAIPATTPVRRRRSCLLMKPPWLLADIRRSVDAASAANLAA